MLIFEKYVKCRFLNYANLQREKNALDEEEVKMEDEKQRAVLFEDAISQGNKQMQVCQVTFKEK